MNRPKPYLQGKAATGSEGTPYQHATARVVSWIGNANLKTSVMKKS